MDILLSLSTIIRFFVMLVMLLSPSSDTPHVSDPSPMIAIIFSLSFLASLAAAIPSAAEIAVPAWPAPNGSYLDSSLEVKPAQPLSCLRVLKKFLRSVKTIRKMMHS